ncbi:MAG TPA: hypothetical protein VMH86_10525 [Rhizomicrobium sp.]|nr:hypothetical protein [Rhizomicrobium sp.]
MSGDNLTGIWHGLYAYPGRGSRAPGRLRFAAPRRMLAGPSGTSVMLKTAAALLLVTQLGNAAPAPNSNLDASPPATASQQGAQNGAAPYTQPGGATDTQFQHGAVDPRGTGAEPLVVRVAAMPPAPMQPQQPSPPGPGLPLPVMLFGLVQILLLGAVVYFLMQSAAASRRMAEAVERLIARSGDGEA